MKRVILIVFWLISFHGAFSQLYVDFSMNSPLILDGQSCEFAVDFTTLETYPLEELMYRMNDLFEMFNCPWLSIKEIIQEAPTRGLLVLRAEENTTGSTRQTFLHSTMSGAELLIKQNVYGRDIHVYEVSGEGKVFFGLLLHVYLSGSEVGVNYRLMNNGNHYGTIPGTGGPLVFDVSSGGYYSVVAEKNGALRSMAGSAVISTYSFANKIRVENPGMHNSLNCNGEKITVRVHLLVDPDGCFNELYELVEKFNTGIVYNWPPGSRIQLHRMDYNMAIFEILVGPNVGENGKELFLVLDVVGECQIELWQAGGGELLTYNVTGGGYLEDGRQVTVGLDGSQPGVLYHLFRDGNIINDFIGFGEVIKLTNITGVGTYTVKAFSQGLEKDMAGFAEVKRKVDFPDYVAEYTCLSEVNKVKSVSYVDGLGRVIQKVQVAASPGGKDVVEIKKYDIAGRVSKEFLPYAVTGDGNFRVNGIREQGDFYLSLHGANAYPSLEKVFNDAPGDNVIETSAPGTSWRLGGGHTTRYEYRLNSEEDAVKKYVLEGTSVRLSRNYAVSELSVTRVVNPQNDVLLEYHDLNGNLIAKESRLASGKKVYTYHVCDDFGRLRYIIPPLQDSLFTSGVKTLEVLSKYCYYTEYDEYGRVYKQYKPGGGYTVTLYDKRGRPVFSQDAEERKTSTWSFTKYDIYDRPVIRGHCTGTEVQHSVALRNQQIFGEKRGTALHGYTNVVYPTAITAANCLLISYYDDYSWTGQSSVAYSAGNAIGGAKIDDVLGLETGMKTKVLGVTGEQWLFSANYFDKKYQAVQTVAQLYPSGIEIVSNSHDFTGLVTRSKVKQTVGSLVTEYNKYFTYDSHKRLVKQELQITGDAVNGRITLVENVYDELGQVSSRKLHNGKGDQSFSYAVNGSLTGVTSPFFSYKLYYDQVNVTGATARYDGNVNAMTWKNGNGVEKAYIYTYDPMGQLGGAAYKEKSGTSWGNNSGKYSVSDLAYDLNGNLRRLRRNNASGERLHALSYSYDLPDNGNAVSRLTLNGTPSATYVYNANGNMTMDGRRGTTIVYNELNLPLEIRGGGENISYVYSATGEKLAQKVVNRTGTSLTYYRGVMVYSGNALDHVLHPLGVVRKTSGGYVYNYFLTDHLGNTRVMLEASENTLTSVQATEYYPFGLAFTYNSLDKNKYLFSGKEIQDVAFNNEVLGMYDFGSRFYDPFVGRWFCQDPASQLVSPYGYCGNNPVAFVDPNGESFGVAFGIGALLGMWTGGTLANDGQMNPGKWDWQSGRTWGYMAGGAAIGGASGALGGAIVAEGGFMANTGSIMASSYVNSLGMSVMTGGEMMPSISFGVASLDFSSGFNYLGKRGNKWLQNLGYTLGAFANLSDINLLINKTNAKLYTEANDAISHSAVVDENENILMSFGPNDSKFEAGRFKSNIIDGKPILRDAGSYKKFALAFRKGTSNYNVYSQLPVDVVVNKYIFSLTRSLGKILPYQGATINCCNMASLSLWLNGIMNVGVHPYMLYFSTLAYSNGFRPDLFSYHLIRK